MATAPDSSTESVTMGVGRLTGLLRELECLRERSRRARRTTIGACILVAVVLLLCGTQFVATWMTCRMLQEARSETAAVREEAATSVRELKEARQLLHGQVMTQRLISNSWNAGSPWLTSSPWVTTEWRLLSPTPDANNQPNGPNK